MSYGNAENSFETSAAKQDLYKTHRNGTARCIATLSDNRSSQRIGMLKPIANTPTLRSSIGNMRVLDYRGVGTHTLYSTTANRRSPPSVARRGISAPSFLANFALDISIKHYLNLTTPANISADWALCLEDYFTHLTLEKGLSPNSIAAYQHDIELLRDYAESKSIAPTLVQQSDIETLIMQVGKDGALGPRSQVRLVSGLRGFFNYLLLEDRIENSPMEHIAPPRLGEHLPAVLSPAEVAVS